jgi:nucleotide-binding universal stress UspA family protein
VRTSVHSGSPYERIAYEARKTFADGIAISAHTLSKGLGSVAKKVVERAQIPVVVWVRERSEKPLVQRPSNFLVPLDGTEESERILGLASGLLDRKGSQITLLRVGMKSYWTLGGVPPSATIPSSELQSYLKDVSRRLGAPNRVKCVVHRGEPVETIVEEAKNHDMVLMASRHRRGVAKLFHGSVAQELLESVPVPLLVA